MIERVKKILQQEESIRLEFKASKNALPKDIYETVCAFSNTAGGEILLGVEDNGNIVGVNKDNLVNYRKDFANTINNLSKISPTLYLDIEEVVIDNKLILYIHVPQSSSVHNCAGKIFIRSNEGDINITHQQSQVAQLYIKKDKSYTINEILPNLTMDSLREDVIEKCRKMAVQRIPTHPWKNLTNEELIRSAGLYREDTSTKEKGYTLACLLLFGQDLEILNLIPHYRTDLLLRVQDVDRYDDRDMVKTNLIDSYDRIMAFVSKHLPSPFYLEGDMSMDLRSILFREITSNLLIHREFTYRYYARLIIEVGNITIENANKPYIHGNINPSENMPYPKNPVLANFFKEIGLADELGSGVRKISKYAKAYAGYDPELEDGELFKFKWKTNFFTQFSTDENNTQSSEQVTSLKVATAEKKGKSGKLTSEQVTPATLVSEQVANPKTANIKKKSKNGKANNLNSKSKQVTPPKIPATNKKSKNGNQKSAKAKSEQVKKILLYCTTERTLAEIMNYLSYSSRGYFMKAILSPLIEQGNIQKTNKNINAPNQKYITVKKISN